MDPLFILGWVLIVVGLVLVGLAIRERIMAGQARTKAIQAVVGVSEITDLVKAITEFIGKGQEAPWLVLLLFGSASIVAGLWLVLGHPVA